MLNNKSPVQEQPMEEDTQEAVPQQNPVIEALQTLQTFIASRTESQDPNATKMLESYKGLLQSFGAAGGNEEQQPSAMKEKPAGPTPTGKPVAEPSPRIQPVRQNNAEHGGANAVPVM